MLTTTALRAMLSSVLQTQTAPLCAPVCMLLSIPSCTPRLPMACSWLLLFLLLLLKK
jgi:hypothetical protein